MNLEDGYPAGDGEGIRPGETAAAVLTTPGGRQAATFDCSARSVDQQTVAVAVGEEGFWKLSIGAGSAGVLDDVYLRLLDGVAPCVVVEPDKALVVGKPGR